MDRSHQFRLLWASKYWVLLFAVAAGVAAYVVSSLMTDKYRADALGQIVSTRQAQGDVLSEEELLSLSNLYVKLADTNTVLRRAHDEPGVAGKEAEFDSSVSVEPEERVGVLSFTAETDNARESADFANAYATAFAAYTEELQARQRDQALERIQNRIDMVSAELDDLGGAPDDPRGVGLRAELAALQERAADETANPGDTARVIERAFPPSSPDSPKPLRNAVLAFIAALVLAAVALYLRETLFDRYGSPEEAASDLGLPVLGEIPKASHRALALESFRSLRTAALLALERSAAASGGNGAREDGGGELLITGPEPGCGKSYVTANLARALAAEGRSVVAVDADMRRPTLHEQFGVASQPGLGDLLVGDGLAGYTGQLAAPVQAVPGSIAADGELRVLTAGPHIENSVERLSSERMEEIVERLRAQSDVVVFDSPPTLAVVDPVVLARYVDGVIVVIDSRKTKRRDARRSVQELRAIGAPVLGFVFNRVRGRRAGYYSYQPQREPRGRRLGRRTAA